MHVRKSRQGRISDSAADLVLFVCAFLVFAVTTPALADLFAAGRRIVIDGPVNADVVLAGATVNIGGAIGADLLATGGTMRVAKSASEDRGVKFAQSSVISSFLCYCCSTAYIALP